ncbi:MAG: hypothetical protein Q8N98_01780, partial [bacterium]|nr:hypothetical protein [bacterium]
MKKQIFFLTTIIALAAILRLWRLGEIPIGVSPEEENFIKFATPFFIRLPFSIIGILEVILIFTACKKLSKSSSFSLVGAFFLAVLPWHIQQSRIYSLNLIIFGLAMLAIVVFAKQLLLHPGKISIVIMIVSLALFLLAVPYRREELIGKIHWQRDTVAKTAFGPISFLFANKITESYRYREKLLLENLDFGNYFFKDYPGGRTGAEETQKLYLIMLPLIIPGLFIINKQLAAILFSWTVFFLGTVVFLNDRGAGAGLSLAFPAIFLAVNGIVFFWRKTGMIRKPVLIVFIIFLLFEFGFFARHYFYGLGESRFSPRAM